MATFMDDLEGLAGKDLERQRVEQASKEQGERLAAPGAPRQAMSPKTVVALQRAVGNAGTTSYLQRDDLDREDEQGAPRRSPVHDAVGSGGEALDQSTRSTMEKHFGQDLSDVRVHVDRGSAESVQAAAYTVGNDIVLHPDHFSPGTPAAQRTMAHEITHVVQQRSGPVAGTEREGGIKVSDPSDRFEKEAEESAAQLTSTQRIDLSSAASHPAVSLQREDEEDEAEVQEISLQREDEEDEAEVQEIALQREDEEEAEESSE